jgi:hypothetical protein
MMDQLCLAYLLLNPNEGGVIQVRNMRGVIQVRNMRGQASLGPI